MAVTINGTTGIVTPDIGVDGSTLVIDSANNRVGVLEDSPSNTLTVGDTVQPSYAPTRAGNYIEIARTSGADAGLLINKDTGQWLVGINNGDGANAPLRFEYAAAGSSHPGLGAGTLGMIINHDGNVGIGTDNPFNATGYKSITLAGSTGGAIAFREGATTRWEIYGDNSNGIRFYDRTNTTERLRITNTGNITYGNQISATANNSSALAHISAGKEYWSGTEGDYRAVKHRIYDNTIDDMYGIGISASLLEIQSQVDIGFFAGGAGTGTGRRHERMRIEGNTGNVSIGTASPGGFRLKVQVADSGSYQSAMNLTNNVNADFQIELKSNESRVGPSTNTPLTIKNGGGDRLEITSDGNIGIGTGTNTPTTGNPSAARFLHIHNSATNNSNSPAEIYFTNANSGPSGGAGGLITFYDTGFYFWNYANDDLHFGTGGNERFKFDHSENTLDFQPTSKIRLRGSQNDGQRHAHINIGSDGGTNADTRAIDIWGNWQDQESKSITWNHGSGASDMVAQQRVRYNSTPSSTYYEIGRFYHGQNTTAFPVRFVSTSTTTANLELDGNLKVPSGNGIDFSATANSSGSMTSELLDDYEEGTFTVTSSGFTNQGGLQTARYVKIGNVVTYMFNFYQNNNNMSWNAGSYFTISAFTPIANFHTSPSISWFKSASDSDTQPAYFNSNGDVVLNAAKSSVRHLWGFVTVQVQ